MRNASGVPDVWILPLTGDRKPFAFVETAPAERTPRLHPTASWIAYQTYETGRSEIYVRPFPPT